jgi:hypothetical protein
VSLGTGGDGGPADRKPEYEELAINARAGQRHVKPGTVQMSDTPHGDACPLPVQPEGE